TKGWNASVAESEDLMIMSQRILGAEEARTLFASQAQEQGISGHLPEPTPDFLQRLERELSGSVGAATAHAMISQIVGGAAVSVRDLMAVADESAQMLEYSNQLEAKSRELSQTAAQLREANTKLMRLSAQKDAFLSQISHELRTPMTSIRAFSEILRDTDSISSMEKTKYANIIHLEAIRLTRLLDDLLDLSVLENGQVTLNRESGVLGELLDQAVSTAQAGAARSIKVHRRRLNETVVLHTDLDRLSQVFINLITNAQKYCVAETPELRIVVTEVDGAVMVDFIDNGAGIPADARELMFEKFSRIGAQDSHGAGLGLAICREIMARLGGDISYLADEPGTGFRVVVPRKQALAAQ
ncbi:MAG: HAMP domain-containing sensor histidine kinase, partial [Pseudomonadota bacterium]